MKATGVFWRPVWHVLEALDGVELLLVNPNHIKNLPVDLPRFGGRMTS